MSDLMLVEGNFPEQPLHSVEMEMATLGSIMLGDDAPKIVRAILPSPEMFYRPSHRRIYHVMLALMDDGLPPELEFIIERLGPEIDHLGNEDYLFQIAEYVPSPSSAEYYAKIVLDLWAKRSLKSLTERIHGGTDLTELSQEIDAIRDGATRGISKPIVNIMGTVDAPDINGITTPWPILNQVLTCEGWPKKQLAIVRAKTGVGKTPFLTQAAIHAAEKGMKVVYATFADLDSAGLQSRMMKLLTGWGKAPHLNLDLSQNWHEQKEHLASLNIVCYDATESSEAKCIETFLSWLKYNHQDVDLVCIDYLQEIKTRQRLDRLERLEEIAGQIKTASAKFNFAALSGAQVSNNAQEGDMTKGGRDSDEKAGLIIDIKPEDDMATGEFRISKSRYGPRVSMPYEFNEKTLGFKVLG